MSHMLYIKEIRDWLTRKLNLTIQKLLASFSILSLNLNKVTKVKKSDQQCSFEITCTNFYALNKVKIMHTDPLK